MLHLSVLDQSPVREGITPRDVREVEYHRRRQIVGTPDSVKAELTALAQSYGVDEIVVLTICHDFAARKRSYTLLAEAFGLTLSDRRAIS